MKIYDLSGNIHTWTPKSSPRGNASSFHKSAKEVLKLIYPFDQILEEVAVPGESLYLDFFIPNRGLVVEVNGQQHYTFTPHFHVDELGFGASKLRDKSKQKWCEINNYDLITLNSKDDADEWKRLILSR